MNKFPHPLSWSVRNQAASIALSELYHAGADLENIPRIYLLRLSNSRYNKKRRQVPFTPLKDNSRIRQSYFFRSIRINLLRKFNALISGPYEKRGESSFTGTPAGAFFLNRIEFRNFRTEVSKFCLSDSTINASASKKRDAKRLFLLDSDTASIIIFCRKITNNNLLLGYINYKVCSRMDLPFAVILCNK
jgi:hypothetical protein